MLELLWIIGTLTIVSSAALIAKKYGSEFIIVLIAACTLMANIFAVKIIDFFGLYVTAGTLIYSVSYYLTDLLSELYGKKKAQKAVWVGFYAVIVYLASLATVLTWPAAPFWQHATAFNETLGMSLRIAAASAVFYLIPQLHDTWAYDFWKRRTRGKYLFVRNNLSTIVSQFIDTTGFVLVAFWGVLEWTVIWQMITSIYIVKLIVACSDTPFLYLVRNYWNKQ